MSALRVGVQLLRSTRSSQRFVVFRSLSSYPPHTVLGLPALSPTMESGTISSWSLDVGGAFNAGDVICEVETDKATVAFEAQDDGYLAKVLVEAGAAEVAVGHPICVVTEEEPDVQAFAGFTLEDAGAGVAPPAAAEAQEEATPAAKQPPAAPPKRTVANEFLLSPAARHYTASRGLDASGLQGTGKGGRITKEDIVKAVASGVPMPKIGEQRTSPTPAPQVQQPAPFAPAAKVAYDLNTVKKTDAPYKDTPASKMRKVISKRLTESKAGVPHFYVSMACELDKVMALRKRLVDNLEIKVSVNDVIIRCAALALRDVPKVNAKWNDKKKTVEQSDAVDISVAVATPNGLITPIVAGADKMGFGAITAKVRDLAGRAREGKLAPEEYQGGSFSISNLGMFDISVFSAVINPPQGAIMAVGSGRAVLDPTSEEGSPKFNNIMQVQLSVDRRVADEAAAAEYLQVFKSYIEEPTSILL